MAAITDNQRADVLRLHGEGLSRNEIARQVGISTTSVSNICRTAGLTFSREQTQKATAAAQIDLAAGRIRLAGKMLALGERAIDRAFEPYTHITSDGEVEELDEMPIADQQRAMTTAGIAFDKITRIVEKSDTGLDQAAGVLDQIAAGFASAAEHYRAEAPTDEA